MPPRDFLRTPRVGGSSLSVEKGAAPPPPRRVGSRGVQLAASWTWMEPKKQTKMFKFRGYFQAEF